MHYPLTDSRTDTCSVCAPIYSIWGLVSTAVWEGVTYKNTHTYTPLFGSIKVCCPERVFLDIFTLWRRTDGVQKVPCLTSPRLSLSLSLYADFAKRVAGRPLHAELFRWILSLNTHIHTHPCAHRKHKWMKISHKHAHVWQQERKWDSF